MEKASRKRRRTGCLSCRARRVKCDERKPNCARCDSANINCAGYDKRREIATPQQAKRRAARGESETRYPDRHSSAVASPAAGSSRPPTVREGDPKSPTLAVNLERTVELGPLLSVRSDGAPLVALFGNPQLSQRPCADARWVLAYHHFLFRTLPVLFPPEHMHFWRDKLCHEAWTCEYIYLALTALGSMHRAALLLAMPGENDRSRGLDTKVIAVQTYIRALESLSSQIDEAKASPDMLIAVLELLAYFEACSIFPPSTPTERSY